MKLLEKLKSRKLAMAGAGMAIGVATDNPLMSIVIGAVYIVAQGLVDAFRRGETPDVKEIVKDAAAGVLVKVSEDLKAKGGITNE